MSKSGKENSLVGNAVPVILVLFLMFAGSGILLFVLSLLTYYLDLSVDFVKIGIYVTYLLSGFLGGILIGKMKKEKKFLWGILMGILYFAVILVVSLVQNGGAVTDVIKLMTVLVLSMVSSMIGGMVS